MKGYKKIVLLGCDCNYVEKIDEAISYDVNAPHKLKINKDVKTNPNYWFDNYQQVGDCFNLPNTDKFQMGSWKNISSCCPSDVTILNASLDSKIPYFEKKNFKDI